MARQRRVSRLEEVPVAIFDGHNDVLTRADHARFCEGRRDGHLDLPRMLASGMRGGIFAVCTPSHEHSTSPAELDPPVDREFASSFCTEAAGRLFALERAGALRVAREVGDLDAALAGEGPPVAVLHLEGAEAVDPGLEALELWYAAGLRSLGPVWSRANAFGRGAPIPGPAEPAGGPGLTDAGVELVRACARLGIVVDLSHLNETGFWDVARLDVGPLVVSHTAAYALSPTPRNLTDAQIDAVGQSGGLIGIVFGTRFVREDCQPDPDTSLDLIAQHARYVADRIGVEHVGLGSDFDGTTIPDSLGGVEGLPRLLAALAQVGFSPAEIGKIASQNWRRVLAAWWLKSDSSSATVVS